MFCHVGVVQTFANFKGHHLCWSLCFDKVAGWSVGPLLKKETALVGLVKQSFQEF